EAERSRLSNKICIEGKDSCLYETYIVSGGSSSIAARTSDATPIIRRGIAVSRRIEIDFPMGSSCGQYFCAKASLTITTGSPLASSASLKLRPWRRGIFMRGKKPESTKRSEADWYSPGVVFRPVIVKLVQKWFPCKGRG